MMPLRFDATPLEVAAASPQERTAWNRRVNASLFGERPDFRRLAEDDAVDLELERDEWCN